MRRASKVNELENGMTLWEDVHKEFHSFNIAPKPTAKLLRLSAVVILTSFALG